MKGQTYQLGYRADLEGLRAVAVLLVVAVHASVAGLGGGFVGVDVFFVLSGFLITGLIVHEADTARPFSFVTFYVRRLRRLMPALLLMVLVVSVVAAVLLAPSVQREQSTAAATAVLWVSNIYFALADHSYFSLGAKTNLFLHTWSLGVEEQFYLVWPALLIWLIRPSGAHGRARLKLGMLVVAAVSLVSCIYLTYVTPRLAFYMMPLRAWQFAAGALVWLYLKEPTQEASQIQPRVLQAAGWIGLGLIVGAALYLHEGMPYPSAWALLPTLGAMGVIAAGCTSATTVGVSRILSWHPLQWLGHVSYSWYLWHWPILLLGAALIGATEPVARLGLVLLSLLIATVSYYLIETPVRSQKLWLMRPRMAVFGALALMILANSLCLNWNTRATRIMQSPEHQRFVLAHLDAPVIYSLGCDDWYHSARVKVCAFGSKKAKHTVVLLGDSHAGQWFPAVAKVFDRRDWRLLVMTKSACPMVDEPFFYERIGKVYTVCAKWREAALAQIAKVKPGVVLLSSALVRFDKSQWIHGTAEVLEKLSPVAGHVFIIRDTPHLTFDGPNCLAAHVGRPQWLNKLSPSCQSSFRDKYANRVYHWLQQVAKRYPNVRAIDMNANICPLGACKAMRDDTVVFRDSQHMTRSFAATLGSGLALKLNLPSLTTVAASQSPRKRLTKPAAANHMHTQ